jgi:hypothetical protein
MLLHIFPASWKEEPAHLGGRDLGSSARLLSRSVRYKSCSVVCCSLMMFLDLDSDLDSDFDLEPT